MLFAHREVGVLAKAKCSAGIMYSLEPGSPLQQSAGREQMNHICDSKGTFGTR